MLAKGGQTFTRFLAEPSLPAELQRLDEKLLAIGRIEIPQQTFRLPDRTRASFEDRGDNRSCRRHELIALDHPIDQPHVQRLPGIDRLGQQEQFAQVTVAHATAEHDSNQCRHHPRRTSGKQIRRSSVATMKSQQAIKPAPPA